MRGTDKGLKKCCNKDNYITVWFVVGELGCKRMEERLNKKRIDCAVAWAQTLLRKRGGGRS